MSARRKPGPTATTRASATEHSVKRQAAEFAGALILAGIVLLAVLGLIGYFLLRAVDEVATMPGGHLSKSAQAEINKKDCAGLRLLLPGYEGNADSDSSGVEGVRAIIKRSEKLNCDPPLRSSFAD